MSIRKVNHCKGRSNNYLRQEEKENNNRSAVTVYDNNENYGHQRCSLKDDNDFSVYRNVNTMPIFNNNSKHDKLKQFVLTHKYDIVTIIGIKHFSITDPTNTSTNGSKTHTSNMPLIMPIHIKTSSSQMLSSK